jgi:hypothetical protein
MVKNQVNQWFIKQLLKMLGHMLRKSSKKKELKVIAYSKRALATQLSSGFSASDLHEKLKVYVDVE